MRAVGACLVGLVLSAFAGCAFVNVSLAPQSGPLTEQAVEGKGKAKILLTDVTGFISEREKSGRLGLRSEPSAVVRIKEELQKAESDDEISGVIIRVNSPGGTIAASDIIYHELMRFREKKKVPVYACIMGIGTSGGYYVSSAADRIYALPTSVTGNIGVIVMTFNVEGLLEKVGVEEETFKSGDKKDFMSLFRRSTPEEREIMMDVIRSMHARFLGVVREGRKGALSPAELEKVADGRIFTAEQALQAKLVDEVGYLDDAIAGMKESIGVEEARIVSYARPGDYRPTIYSSWRQEGPSVLDSVGGAQALPGLLSGLEVLYLWAPGYGVNPLLYGNP